MSFAPTRSNTARCRTRPAASSSTGRRSPNPAGTAISLIWSESGGPRRTAAGGRRFRDAADRQSQPSTRRRLQLPLFALGPRLSSQHRVAARRAAERLVNRNLPNERAQRRIAAKPFLNGVLIQISYEFFLLDTAVSEFFGAECLSYNRFPSGIMIAISLVAAASCAGLAGFGLWQQNNAIDLALHRELQSDYANMIGAMDSDTRALQAVANTLADMPDLKLLIRAQDRPGSLRCSTRL